MLQKFEKNRLSFEMMKSVKGGTCGTCNNCIASNGPACTAAGNSGGSWDTCVVTLRTECENQSYCSGCIQ